MKETEMPTETTPTRVEESATTQKMRAIVQDEYGSADSLRMSAVDIPDIALDEVLVEVAAAGVDRGVWHLLTGKPYLVRLAGYGISKPKNRIPGLDVSGTVVAVGDGVERFRVGDEVFGIAKGAYAEFAVAKEDKLSHKPVALSFEEAAVASISGITALQALVDVGELQAGQSVLVIGASGGVGTYAVQLAKALGATVTGVASGAKADFVRSLGAEHVIDYSAGDYLGDATRYDLIIDIGGRNSLAKLRGALKKTGTLVIVGGEGGGSITGGIGRQLRAKMLSPFVSQRLTFFLSAEHHSHIEKLARFMEDGDVVAALGDRFGLADTPDAIRMLESGQIAGKAVIVVSENK